MKEFHTKYKTISVQNISNLQIYPIGHFNQIWELFYFKKKPPAYQHS